MKCDTCGSELTKAMFHGVYCYVCANSEIVKAHNKKGDLIFLMRKMRIKSKKPRFKSDIIHKAEATPEGVYYRCNHAIGKLSNDQLIHKTNWKLGKKITCKNCRRHLYKR